MSFEIDPSTEKVFTDPNNERKAMSYGQKQAADYLANRNSDVSAAAKIAVAIENGSEDWMAYGKCRDVHPSVFFPSDGAGVEIARKLCKDCPVKSPCLELALVEHIDHGVWGGASERERRRIMRQRRLDAPVRRSRT